MASAPQRPRAVLVIANPVSGGGRARALAPALAAALIQRGVRAEVAFTQRAGDATERARRAGDEPWDALVAAGGDGTVAEVLNGMPDPTRRLGVLPIGTANVLACEYRLPRKPHDVAALVASGRVREHAIGVANERRFLLFCGAGVDGAVVHRLEQVRTGTLGKLKWAGPIAHTLWHWPQFALRAVLDGGETLDGLSSVLVTRVRNYGGVLRLVPDIDPGDGRLHVIAFRYRSRSAWLWQGVRGFTRGLRPTRKLIVKTASSVRIEVTDGEAAPYQLDGDGGGTTPVDVRLDGRAVPLCAP